MDISDTKHSSNFLHGRTLHTVTITVTTVTAAQSDAVWLEEQAAFLDEK